MSREPSSPAHILWVELTTRITTQRIHFRSGQEGAAAESIATLFQTTRELMAAHPGDEAFIALGQQMLNQTLRPCTARWHGWMGTGEFENEAMRRKFRAQLRELQPRLIGYQKAFEALKNGKTPAAKWTRPRLSEATLRELQADCSPVPEASLGGDLEAGMQRQVGVRREPEDTLLSIPQINAREATEVQARRNKLKLPMAGPEGEPLMNASGLALSGGGIRAATFSLGIVQVLARRGLLKQFDYLSTVSGGGYMGTFLTSYLGTGEPLIGTPDGSEPPADQEADARINQAFGSYQGRESRAVRYLRNHSRYLLHGGFEGKLRIALQLITGVIFNILILLPIPILAAVGLAGLKGIGFFGEAAWNVKVSPQEWTAPMVQLMAMFSELPVPGFGMAARALETSWFPGINAAAGRLFALALGFLVLTVLVWPWIQRLAHGRSSDSGRTKARDFWNVLAPAASLLVVIAGGLWATPALLRVYHSIHEGTGVPFEWEALRGRMDAVLGIVGLGVSSILGTLATMLKKRRLLQPLIKYAFLLSGPILYLMVFLGVSWRLIHAEPPQQWSGLGVSIAALGLGAWGWLLLNINTYSPHIYYRDRLCECYLAIRGRDESRHLAKDTLHFLKALLPGDKGNRTESERIAPKVSNQPVGSLRRLAFSDIPSAGAAPYHLIGTTVNLTTSRDPNLRGRDGDFFVISKHHSGSPVCGYVDTQTLEAMEPHLDLGTAMAISGAAASSNMGWKTLHSFRFLMTLTNLRLGYWLRNPLRSKRAKAFDSPGPWYLFKEMFGLMSEEANFLNLSDGGHLENLAVYELLRRRCKFIVCVDSGDEKGMECTDLMRLQRYAEIDLGVKMTFDRSGFDLMPSGLVRSHAILVKVDYDPEKTSAAIAAGKVEEAPLGWILYFKLGLNGTEPEYIRDYKRVEPSFPHQSTADQIYDEAQFEAYRGLGECAMEEALSDELLKSLDASGPSTNAGHPLTLERWFKALASNLLPDDDPVFR